MSSAFTKIGLICFLYVGMTACIFMILFNISPLRKGHYTINREKLYNYIAVNPEYLRSDSSQSRGDAILEPTDVHDYHDAMQFALHCHYKTKEFDRCVSFYRRAISLASTKEGSGEAHIGLARLYKEGMKGVTPDAAKSVEHLCQALRCGYEVALLDIAELYMHGLHPHYLADKVTAGRIYTLISQEHRCSPHATAVARQKLKEIAKMAYADLDAMHEAGRSYRQLPANIINVLIEICHTVHTFIPSNVGPETQVQQPPTPQRRRHKPDTDVMFDIETIDADLQRTLWEDRRPQEPMRALQTSQLYNDPQNVHSSSVQNVAAQKLAWIESASNSKASASSRHTSVQAFLDTVNGMQDLTQEQKDNIRKVMISLKEDVHSRYQRSELDVFQSVWNRIHDPINHDRQQDMIKVLAQNIESGVEHGHVVCSTGKIVRLIGSLDGMDAAEDDTRQNVPKLKPEWLIDREIAEYTAKLREETLNSLSKEDRESYEKLEVDDETQKATMEHISSSMREKLKEKVIGDYVETGIMDMDVLMTRIEPYLDNL